MDKKTVTFTVQMDEDQAYQLAQFLKRVGFSEIRQHASDDAEAVSYTHLTLPTSDLV